ncbi:hypothetical protein D3C86_2139350 [compost metagenome]
MKMLHRIFKNFVNPVLVLLREVHDRGLRQIGYLIRNADLVQAFNECCKLLKAGKGFDHAKGISNSFS